MRRFLSRLYLSVLSYLRQFRSQRYLVIFVCAIALVLCVTSLVEAQSDRAIEQLENQQIRRLAQPSPTASPVAPPAVESPPATVEPRVEPRVEITPAPRVEPRPAPRVEITPAPRVESPIVTPPSPPGGQAPVTTSPALVPLPPLLPLTPTPSPNATSTPRLPQATGATAQPTIDDSIITDNSPPNQYVLQFNRSPVVGNRFHLQGTYNEARLGFTRPRSWKINSAKVLIRYQHSPALIANRSNLTVRINDISIGSVPLNLQQSKVGQVMLEIPPNRLGDFNNINLIVQQHNTEKCEDQDPSDPTLWTDILPDSQIVFNYQRAPYRLDFSTYPFPFFDDLSLEPNQIAFFTPQQTTETWLTETARYNAALGRVADFRPLETRLIKNLEQVNLNERLVILGTPEEQPILKSINLPLRLVNNQFLDGNQNPIAPDIGALMLITVSKGNSRIPVLVVTGNGPEGVSKAVQFLVQPQDRKLSTGRAILVNQVAPVPSPSRRNWPRYLPETNQFKLNDLKGQNNEPFKDITVRGSKAPAITIDFRALPNDTFKRGNYMNLVYSYSPQMNPRTSVVEVLLNENTFIGGARLDNEAGANRQTVKINLPESLIQPDSKLQIGFRMNPREPAICGRVTDQQLTGTLHADTSFDLRRDISVALPDLKLFNFGYPFAAPQDLSGTAIVVPDNPSAMDVMTLMEFSERLGRLSQADSVQLKVYKFGTGSLTERDRAQLNLVGIGLREQFPLPEVFQTSEFSLQNLFSRNRGDTIIQTLPDNGGAVMQIISPWSSDRVLLALTAQTQQGLELVRKVLELDTWFFQLQGDTVLVSSNAVNTPQFDPSAYKLQHFQRTPQRRIEEADLLSKISRIIQENWFLLPVGIILLALILYGISQLYLKRIAAQPK